MIVRILLGLLAAFLTLVLLLTVATPSPPPADADPAFANGYRVGTFAAQLAFAVITYFCWRKALTGRSTRRPPRD